LILCGVILCIVAIFFTLRSFRETNSHVPILQMDSKLFQQILPKNFVSNYILDKNRSICVAASINAPVKRLSTVVSNGDTLPKIFKRFGINDNSALAVLKFKQTRVLRKMRPGHKLSLSLNPVTTKVQSLTYEIDDLTTLIVTLVNNKWQVKESYTKPASAIKYIAMTIDNSIYAAGRRAGISYKLISQVVEILNYKISVNKLRSGDKLALFYREYNSVNGKKNRNRELVAIELSHANKVYHIIGFTDPHGHTNFYTPDGHRVGPSFFRYPVGFKKVTSKFSFSRVHPILGVSRPHLGVDFAASAGTPVRSTSDGKIEFAGNKGGYGKTIVIRNGAYSTLYAHLSKFSKNIFSGKFIKQGEVIGYVGASGLATSPHLHYEFRIHGIHLDPLKVKLPSGEMISREYRGRFFALSKKVLIQLDLYRKTNRIFATHPFINVWHINC
jgi:murein DD-endopeptidase MepM/ murein hydrolase activator NlpD